MAHIPSLAICALLLSCGSAVAQRFDELVGAGMPRLEPNPRSSLLLDVDGDGDRDLLFGVAVLLPGRPLTLYENVGEGRFEPAASSAVPGVPLQAAALAAGDLDGDSFLDVLVGVRDGGQDRIYRGGPGGTLTDATAQLAPTGMTDTRGVALRDVDGDGDLDALLCRDDTGCVAWLNDGQGVMTDVVALPTVSLGRPVAILAEDFDGQPGVEIVAVGRDGRGWLWQDDGQGGFVEGAVSWFPALLPGIADMAAGDLDGDGDFDLVLARAGQPDLQLRNDQGVATFTPVPLAPAAPAFDSSCVTLADVDGDTDLDVVLGDLSGPDRMLLNRGNGSFDAPAGATWPERNAPTRTVVSGDLDGDGDFDVVFGRGPGVGRPGRFELLNNDGTGHFVNDTFVSAPLPYGDTRAVATGDFDADGFQDLIIAGRDLPAALWRGARDGSVDLRGPQDVFGSSMPVDVAAIAVGDVDGDSDLDVLLGANGAASLYLNDGTGLLQPAPAGGLPPQSADVVDALFVDIDGDLDLDVYLVAGGASVQFPQSDLLWRNDGSGVFTDVSAAQLPPGAHLGSSVAAGDVDGDGDMDLLVGNRSVLFPIYPAQPDRLLLNDGQGRFTPAAGYPLDASGTRDVALVDVDGDGDLDVVTVCGPEPARVLLGDGQGGFTPNPGAIPSSGRSRVGLVAGDLDGNGTVELAVACSLSPMELFDTAAGGGGAFVAVSADQLPATSWQTAAFAGADFDGDGDVDLVLGNDRGERDVLLRNLARQVDVSVQPRIGRTLRIDAYAAGSGGGLASLYLDLFLLPQPLPVGSFGDLHLPPATLSPLGAYPVPANGPLRIASPLANDPVAVGLLFHLQGLMIPTGSPLDARLSQYTTDIIQR